MHTQKRAWVVGIYKDKVLIEFEDNRRGKFPIGDFPSELKKGDQILVGLESNIKYAVLINGEDKISVHLKRNWNGHTLRFTSTSDSGYIELKDRGDDLSIFYLTDNTRIFLGTITTEWDESHQLAVLRFSNNGAEPNVSFEHLGKKMVDDPIELFYDHTTFHIISDKDNVKNVLIMEI